DAPAGALFRAGDGPLQIIDDGQELQHQVFRSPGPDLFDLAARPLAEVVKLRLQAQPTIEKFVLFPQQRFFSSLGLSQASLERAGALAGLVARGGLFVWARSLFALVLDQGLSGLLFGRGLPRLLRALLFRLLDLTGLLRLCFVVRDHRQPSRHCHGPLWGGLIKGSPPGHRGRSFVETKDRMRPRRTRPPAYPSYVNGRPSRFRRDGAPSASRPRRASRPMLRQPQPLWSTPSGSAPPHRPSPPPFRPRGRSRSPCCTHTSLRGDARGRWSPACPNGERFQTASTKPLLLAPKSRAGPWPVRRHETRAVRTGGGCRRSTPAPRSASRRCASKARRSRRRGAWAPDPHAAAPKALGSPLWGSCPRGSR